MYTRKTRTIYDSRGKRGMRHNNEFVNFINFAQLHIVQINNNRYPIREESYKK